MIQNQFDDFERQSCQWPSGDMANELSANVFDSQPVVRTSAIPFLTPSELYLMMTELWKVLPKIDYPP